MITSQYSLRPELHRVNRFPSLSKDGTAFLVTIVNEFQLFSVLLLLFRRISQRICDVFVFWRKRLCAAVRLMRARERHEQTQSDLITEHPPEWLFKIRRQTAYCFVHRLSPCSAFVQNSPATTTGAHFNLIQ